MSTPDEMIAALKLNEQSSEIFPAHREIFRSVVKTQATKQRNAANSMLFLQRKEMQSELWYQLRTDEIFSYHAGTPLRLRLIYSENNWDERIVGPDVLGGEFPQCVVPAWTWRHLSLIAPSPQDAWGLFGSFVIPAFDPADYAEKSPAELAVLFPKIFDEINQSS